MRYIKIFESFNTEQELIELISDCMVDLEDFLTNYVDCRKSKYVKHLLCFYEYDIPKEYLYMVKNLEEKLNSNNIIFELECTISDNDNQKNGIKIWNIKYTDNIESVKNIYNCDLYYVGFLFKPVKKKIKI